MQIQDEEKESGYIKVDELAEMLGIGISSVYEIINTEGFPAIPHGKKGYIIPRITFMNWLSDPHNIIEYRNKVKGYLL